MLYNKRPKVCDGRGECFRRYTKYYYYKHEDVICDHDCILIHCFGCKCLFPQWHYDLFSSGKCYDCNKQEYESEIDSDEDELRSDASLDSGGSIVSNSEDTKSVFVPISEYFQERQKEEEEEQQQQQQQQQASG